MATDVFVIAEHLGGKLTDATFECLAAARGLGGDVVAVLGGSGNSALAGELGAADRVILLDDPSLDAYSPDAYEAALRAALGPRDWRIALVPNTTVGMDLAAGLAAHLAVPVVAYATSVGAEDGTIVATAQIYGGKILADVALPSKAIVSLVPGSISGDTGRASGSPALERVGPAGHAARVRLLSYETAPSSDVDITKESVLVSVGRGLGGPENLEVAEELAKALGGVVSGSRPVTDAGWLPRSRQVGKSGVTVKAKLYLALGISGAPEHLQGMRDCECIIAVNTDASAPIFDVAHYGIVGDVLEVASALTERLAQKV